MPRCLLAAVLLCLPLTGCARQNTVRGTVTYDGVPVPLGYISFFPVQGTGASVGADIVDGAFLLHGIAPGKQRVLVTSQPNILATRYAPGENPTIELMPTPQIPANAAGNNQLIDVTTGEQTINLDLRPPKPNSERRNPN